MSEHRHVRFARQHADTRRDVRGARGRRRGHRKGACEQDGEPNVHSHKWNPSCEPRLRR